MTFNDADHERMYLAAGAAQDRALPCWDALSEGEREIVRRTNHAIVGASRSCDLLRQVQRIARSEAVKAVSNYHTRGR